MDATSAIAETMEAMLSASVIVTTVIYPSSDIATPVFLPGTPVVSPSATPVISLSTPMNFSETAIRSATGSV